MSSTITALTSGGGLAMAGDTSGQLELKTNNGTTAVTVTTAQKVGVGTTSPAGKLDIYATYASDTTTQVRFQDNTGTCLDFGGTGGGVKWLNVCDVGAPSTGYPLAFQTASTERMRIDSSGNLLVGATTTIAGEKLNVTNNASAGSVFGTYIKYSNSAPNGSSNEFLYCSDTSTVRAYIKSNGGIGNYSANNTNLSDERTKKDITEAGNYLDKICAIPVRTFLYKDQTDNELNLGVVAQEVEAVAPELVDNSGFGGEKEGEIPLKAIYQTDLQYALMKCIQELNAKVDAQALEIQALKGVA